MKKITSIFLALLFIGVLQAQDSTEITLDKIYKEGLFYPKSVRGIQSMKDGEHYCKISRKGIEEYSYKTGDKTRMIIDNNTLFLADSTPVRYRGYEFSPNEELVLLATETEAIYRHSSKSSFYIYSLKDQSLSPVSKNGKQRLTSFSPDGKKLAFVRENN